MSPAEWGRLPYDRDSLKARYVGACGIAAAVGRFGFDAAILFSDILVVPHALGQRVTFEQGEGPRLDALEDAAALNGLRREIDHKPPVADCLGPRQRSDLLSPCRVVGVAALVLQLDGRCLSSPWPLRDWGSRHQPLLSSVVDPSGFCLSALVGARPRDPRRLLRAGYAGALGRHSSEAPSLL